MTTTARQQRFETLVGRPFDALIIGGGITGAGIAWQLARHGVKTALVEQGDYASGTSSRSSKLIHGGFRYLPHGEIRLIRHVSRERTRLAHLMPHLIQPLAMTIPAYHDGPFSLKTLAMGVWLYDHLSHTEKSLSHHRLSIQEVAARTPGIAIPHLSGGISYFEFSGHDARINWSVIHTAQALGAFTMNYVFADLPQSLLKPDGISQILVHDRLSGRTGHILARIVVNAAGPWADHLDPSQHLVRSRGVHLVFARQRFPLTHATILPTPENANIFAVPRGPVTYLGTTDQPDTGSIDSPSLPIDDVRYLLQIANHLFPQASLKLNDIIAAWSGMRPLVAQDVLKKTDRLSRRDMIVVKPSLITVLGGKFTGFRATAESVARTVLEMLGGTTLAPVAEFITAAPSPGQIPELLETLRNTHHVTKSTAHSLVERYGLDSLQLLEWARETHQEIDPIMNGIPLLGVEVSWAILREEAVSLADILIRRTGLAWLGGIPPEKMEELMMRVADRMRTILSWDADEIQRQVQDCHQTSYLTDVLRWRES